MDICLHNDKCGGCMFQGKTYESQLAEKKAAVLSYLEESGLKPELLSEIKDCPVRYNYRNKMEYSFGDEIKDGPMQLGMHKKGSFISISTTNHCQIVPEDFNIIVDATLDFCIQKGYSHYNKKSHKGLMRSLVLRWGVRTSQLLVNIVTSTESEFNDNEYVSLLQSLDLDNSIVGIIHTYNDNISDMINPEKVITVYGNPYYEEEVLGLKFKVGAYSFFQTNVPAAERLYKDALDLIPDLENKTVYDLYCGTGTISQAMALKAKRVIGVEIVEEAVDAAKANAEINGLDNCEFIAGDVQKVLDSIAELPDVIVVDPPRSGMSPKALAKVLSYGVKNIVYISCNPKTLAENLRAVRLYGYEISSLTAYDNFPFTKHVEAVAFLSGVEKLG